MFQKFSERKELQGTDLPDIKTCDERKDPGDFF
jgi:hypothetical protein